jgi:hypothetical protein
METERPLYHIRPRTPSHEIPAKKIRQSKRTYHIWMSSDKGSENTPASITSKIDKLNVENYEIGLAEISFPNTWLNLTEPQVVGLVKLDDNSSLDPTDDKTTLLIHCEAKIKPGYYTKYADLILEINNQYMLYANTLMQQNLQIPDLTYDKEKGKTTFNAHSSLKPFFSDQLAEMLGFEKSSIDEKFKLNENNEWYLDVGARSEMKNSVWYVDSKTLPIKENKTVVESNFHQTLKKIRSLYLYSDIIDGPILNGKRVALLRKISIPHEKKYGEEINISYDNIHYYPLNVKELSSIQVIIKDEKDNKISLKGGTTFIHLILRERK